MTFKKGMNMKSTIVTANNEWKDIIRALDSAGMHDLTWLSSAELAKLEALLDHWQKLTAGELSKRVKSSTSQNVTA